MYSSVNARTIVRTFSCEEIKKASAKPETQIRRLPHCPIGALLHQAPLNAHLQQMHVSVRSLYLSQPRLLGKNGGQEWSYCTNCLQQSATDSKQLNVASTIGWIHLQLHILHMPFPGLTKATMTNLLPNRPCLEQSVSCFPVFVHADLSQSTAPWSPTRWLESATPRHGTVAL